MELTESADKRKKPVGFFKEKIVMNASLAYGIFLSAIVERFLVELRWVRKDDKIIVMCVFLAIFLSMMLLSAFWGKAYMDKIKAEKPLLKRLSLTYKEPAGAWGVLFAYTLSRIFYHLFQ